jgi:hypothetical protein
VFREGASKGVGTVVSTDTGEDSAASTDR